MLPLEKDSKLNLTETKVGERQARGWVTVVENIEGYCGQWQGVLINLSNVFANCHLLKLCPYFFPGTGKLIHISVLSGREVEGVARETPVSSLVKMGEFKIQVTQNNVIL